MPRPYRSHGERISRMVAVYLDHRENGVCGSIQNLIEAMAQLGDSVQLGGHEREQRAQAVQTWLAEIGRALNDAIPNERERAVYVAWIRSEGGIKTLRELLGGESGKTSRNKAYEWIEDIEARLASHFKAHRLVR